MIICEVNETNMDLIPSKMNLDIIGRVIPSFDGISWSYNLVINEHRTKASFPTSKINDLKELNDKRHAYIIMDEKNNYAGHCVMDVKFNNLLYIEDLDICEKYRKKRYAYELMNKVVQLSKDLGLQGVTLEVQDSNVIAFKFYIKYGFNIGGFDNMFYKKTVQKDDNAIYMYLWF